MRKSKFLTRKRIIMIASAVALLILAVCAFDTRLYVRKYSIDSDEIETQIRLALVTDLHSCDYGENQSELVNAIDKQKPDILLLGGDIFDDVKDDSKTEQFLEAVADRYICYYVTGNHECWGGTYRFEKQMAILEKYGITVLSGESVTLAVNGETINLCGVDDPHIYLVEQVQTDEPLDENGNKMQDYKNRLNNTAKTAENGYYTVLLSHRPEFFELYDSYDFDLVLCGHAHGGQWRIPFLLNGLYAPHQGIFPKYAGGKYSSDDMTMIVSRGLARETTKVPRIFNRPELVVIDLE